MLRRAGATRHTKYWLLSRMFVSIYRFLDSRDENSGSHQANHSIKVQTKSDDIIKAYDMISGTGKVRNNAHTVFIDPFSHTIMHRVFLVLIRVH